VTDVPFTPEAATAVPSRPPWGVLVGVALVGACVVSLGAGAIAVPVSTVVAVLLEAVGLHDGAGVDGLHRTVVLEVRAPRVATGVLLGASLGVAGALVQGWFRNPLADPGLVGVSAGATLGAASSIVAGGWVAWMLPGWVVSSLTPIGAILGALVATAIVLQLGRVDGRIHVATVLLAGIAVMAMAGALVGLLTVAADDTQLRDLTFWTMGSLGGSTWSRMAWMAAPLLVGLVASAALVRPLDALLLGESTARSLGVEVTRVGPTVAVLASVLTGVGVAACGQVGFIGLVAPHLVRLVTGPRHATVVPGAALVGAILVVVADLVSRTAVAPIELPIGVVTALIGGPVFLHLLPRAVRGLS